MDGDVPDQKALHRLKTRFGFTLFCDEAHSFLSLGKTGRGCVEWWNDSHSDRGVPTDLMDIRTTTLSKAVGSVGGLVCATEQFAAPLAKGSANSRLYGETLPVPPMIQTLWALRQPQRVRQNLDRLRKMSIHCHDVLRESGVVVYGDRSTPILPVIAGRPTYSAKLSHALRKRSVLTAPFGKPAVPQWQSRVRISLSAGFTDQQVTDLVNAVIVSCEGIGVLEGKVIGLPRPFESHESSEKDHLEAETALASLNELISAEKARVARTSTHEHAHEDVLGFKHCRPVIEAGQRARRAYGLGSGSSRWILGTFPPHIEVERRVSACFGLQTAMIYTNAEMGLLSTVAALASKVKGSHQHRVLIPDKAQRAVLDGLKVASRNSAVTMSNYSNPDSLQMLLRDGRKQNSHITIVLNAHEANDGLAGLTNCLAGSGAGLAKMTILVAGADVASEFHSSKIVELLGRLSRNKCRSTRVLVFGSFYDAFNLSGAFLAGDRSTIEELRLTSRCYIFTAASPPYLVRMIAKSLELTSLQDER
jgi:serine palmitoyltransferase